MSDPNALNSGLGSCVWSRIEKDPAKAKEKLLFIPETPSHLKHDKKGLVAFKTVCTALAITLVVNGSPYCGSQFLITLVDKKMEWLDGKQALFGQVVEGLEIIDKINACLCDEGQRPFRDIIIKHTVILDDPFDDPAGLEEPPESPQPTKAQLAAFRLGMDEELQEEGLDEKELERWGRLIDLGLNPVTQDEDLKIIFGRFGKILR
ncbi:Peptidyl-prolyl cis-trans isomerase cyp6 [Kappamyces sp. JEL0829]|nr:Peptidyl-prolyl cis-trans isomerase cyp6 [Kappamyces sp. JEL0829]